MKQIDRELINSLAEKKLSGSISKQEEEWLYEWIKQMQESDALWETDADEALLKERLLSKIKETLVLEKEVPKSGKVVSFGKWAAAVLLLLAGSYFIFMNPIKSSSKNYPLAMEEVIAPQSSKAVLTLADGTTINLDEAENGSLSVQGNVKVEKLENGQIAYSSLENNHTTPQSVSYNTLVNPRGSRVIDITLADGSRIWLNAASSITYPVHFSEKERKVTITGEAYFDIASEYIAGLEEKKPFVVESNGATVTVLGTEFNINSYEDEEDTKVTLVEGSVKVTTAFSNTNKEQLLKPGEQMLIESEKFILNKSPDMEEVLAWKNGLFIMKGTSLPVLLRQLSRWYNIKVEQVGALPNKKFGGTIGKDINLNSMIEVLNSYGIEAIYKNGKLIIEKK